MAIAIHPAELLATAPGVGERLAVILRQLITIFARVFYRHPRYAPFAMPLCLWLQRTIRRFDRVMAHLAAGTLRQHKSRPGRPSSGKPRPAFPRQRAWLLAALKHEGAYIGGRIEALLADPETAALIAATPQAQRLLRPLCRMLGVRHASLDIKPAALKRLPLPRAAEGRGPPRSDGKGEGAAAGREPVANPNLPSPLPRLRARAAKRGPRTEEGPAAGTPPDPYADLCPRLRTRWPFNQLPQFRQA